MHRTHSLFVGYLAWVFGIFGAHRFYFGKPISGLLYVFTLGLFGVGWLVDLFLIPSMESEASRRFSAGEIDYSVTWIMFVIGGVFGFHRFYMGDVLWGILYAISGGLLGLGLIYDALTLNDQVATRNYLEGRQIAFA